MNRDFLIDEMLIPDQFPISFLLKKYIIQKYIEQIINEKNKNKHLVIKNLYDYVIYIHFDTSDFLDNSL